jgi:hypothetical protein
LLADETKKRSIKRQGANVLILVDQFEEFFTNQENFTNGIPSVESQLVMNVLLETAKIAHSQDLPIYVVCTMRSDYIGQCAAFRGLPEMIGFSQFFVPRLKRKEIQQVITEPAKLAGCQITTRLSETLINELGSGFDQLPVLQHALNQLWQLSYGANGNGKEMDLLSLAKLGGISTQTLNEEEKKEFEKWESKISTYKKKYLKNPSLENVLNAHADELYENAADYYNASQATKISEDTAKQIIKIAFQCLVKTDEGRTVRSRMTLREITKIINIHSIDEDTVAGVLEIFRLQGNTFLKPYKDEQEKLERNTVLDITHESLIRNWARLKEWAKEEYEDYQTYLDFNKQLQRWLANNKSSGYLLPIGPLTYFENWYNTCEPNANWLARYDDREIEHQQKIVDAEENLKQAQHFIKKSANKLFFSRTVLKYGANNILAVAAIFVLICSCTYFYFDYRKKQNDYVLNQILEDGIKMLQSKNIDPKTKAEFIINYDRLKSLNKNGFELNNKAYVFPKLLDSIHNDSIAFHIGIEMLKICGSYTKGDTLLYDMEQNYSIKVFKHCKKLCFREIKFQLENLNEKTNSKLNIYKTSWIASKAMLLKFNNPTNETIDSLNQEIVDETKDLIFKYILEDKHRKTKYIQENLTYILPHLLALDSKPNYRRLLEILSPYENINNPKRNIFSLTKDTNEIYVNCNKIPKGGTFEVLSMLYASEYETNPKAKGYLTSLLDSSINYNHGIYVPRNITDVLFKFCRRPIEAVDFVNERTGLYKLKSRLDYWDLQCKNLFSNLSKNESYEISDVSNIFHFISNETKELIWVKNLETINKEIKDGLDKQYKLCKYYKLRGFYCYKYLGSLKTAEQYFENSLSLFEKIPISINEKNYLEQKYKRDELSPDPYQILFFYPLDYMEWMIGCNFKTSTTFTNFVPASQNSIFFNYIIKSKRQNLYISTFGLQVLQNYSNYSKDSLTLRVIGLLGELKSKGYYKPTKYVNYILSLINILELVKENKIDKAKLLMTDRILRSSNNQPLVEEIAYFFLKQNKPELALLMLNTIEQGDYETWAKTKAKIYLNLCHRIQTENLSEYTFLLLDKYNQENVSNEQIQPSYFRLLGNIGGSQIDKICRKKFRNVLENKKPQALMNWIIGTAERNEYYKAVKLIPNDVSENSELDILNQILKVEILKAEQKNQNNSFIGKWDDSDFFKYEFGRENKRDYSEVF